MSNTSLLDKVRAGIAAFRSSGTSRGDMQTSVGGLNTEDIDILRGLSPSKVAQILNDADNGDIVEQHKLFAKIEDEDEHIATELSKRTRALMGLNWTINPAVTADAASQKKAEAVAEVVRGLFDSIPNYTDMLLGFGSAVGHGFTAFEMEWGLDGKFHVPVGLHFRPQHWFCLEKETRALHLRTGFESEALRPLGWMVHEHKSKAGWFARYGLFRVLVTTYLLKKYGRSGFAEFTEIHGMPLRIGKYPMSATQKEKTHLLNGLRQLGRDAAAIIPAEMEVEFKEAVKASADPYATLWEMCEKGQSKAILGGTLTTQADGKTSTNALGNVHNDVRRDIRNADAEQIAATLTQKLLLPLAVLNCDLQDPKLAPYFTFDTAEPEDLTQLADAFSKLAGVMRIPAKWAHEKTRIPMAEEGEEVLQVRGYEQQKDDAEEDAPEEKTGAILPPNHAQGKAAAKQNESHVTGRDEGELALENGLDSLNASFQNSMETMLAPLFDAVTDGLPPEELMARLSSLYPQFDTAALQEQMARVYFVSELWGRLRAQADTNAAEGA